MGLQYKLCYKKGVDNKAADALSRIHPQDSLEILAVSTAHPVWLEEVMQAYSKYPETSKLLSSLSVQQAMGDYVLHEGLIRFRGKILVPPDVNLQHKIVSALHSSAVGGHSGPFVTYHKVKQLFFWHGMKKMIHELVTACQVCQQAKSERVKYPGLLQPVPVPQFTWQVVTMDFIEGLPCSHKYNCILVVVDKLSKYAHFVPLQHPFTPLKVATAYMDHIFKLHGLPETIVSDRENIHKYLTAGTI